MTIPTRASTRTAIRWAGEQEAFIEERLRTEIAAIPFALGTALPVLGRRVFLRPGRRGRDGIEGDKLLLYPGEPAALRRRCEKVLRRAALEAATRDLQHFWSVLSVPAAEVSVRAYERRWGCCRRDGHTTINWRLVFAPRFVLEHVCAHEAAHRIEMNHGRRFWRLLKEIDPRTEEARAWLKTEGRSVYAYGAPGMA